MRSHSIVIASILSQDPAQMRLAQHAADHNAIGEYVKVIVIPVPRGARS